MPTFLTYFWIALGGALGSMGRFWIDGLVSRHFDIFPAGTLVINVTGSFLISFFGTLTSTEGRWLVPSNTRIFFMTGVCGGYTTFSSFSWQTLNLARDGEWRFAGLYIVMSVTLCLLAAWLGYIAAAFLNSRKGH
ncbi:MAG TPA: fluoride efflux transporter CrcB [Verrucomicrobiae bacterium]|jgi:CrcB protein|nr:fluoride efflux transporter CrcB [Verrucomicrobiae bacterium]